MDGNDFADMPLTAAVQAFMAEEEWEDPLETNDDRTTSTLATTMLIDEQRHRLYLETVETDQRLFVYLYTPYNVPRARLDVMARVLNRVNTELGFGRLAVDDGAEPRPVQFKCAIDVEGSSLAPIQVAVLVGLALATFRDYGRLLAAAAMSRRAFSDLWLEHLEDKGECAEVYSPRPPRVLN
jgi:hypothetical protein